MISSLADQTILTSYHNAGPGTNGTITRVVIHGTVSPCQRGGAVANARYFQNPSAGGAAHYIVDPGEIVCSVDEDRKAYHAPPNAGSIGIELTDPQVGDSDRWNDDDHQVMLAKAAELTVEICSRYGLPLVWLSSDDLLAGATGITGHAQVAQAWHQSDHTDPRDMPVDVFMGLVTGSPTPIPTPTPTPQPTEETMQFYYARLEEGPAVYLVNLATKPRQLILFADAEYWAKLQGHTITEFGTDVMGPDGVGQSRKGILIKKGDIRARTLFGF